MRRVFFASRFEKKLKLFHSRHPELSTAVKDTMLAIAGDPHAPALKTHPLHGNLSACFGCRLSREHRIVFVLDPDRVTFMTSARTPTCTDERERQRWPFAFTPSAIEISFRPAFAALFFISAMIVAKAGMRGADTFAQCPDGGYAAGAISKGWRPEFFAVRRETGREQSVKVRYDEGVAIRIGPEPCAVAREGRSEAGVRRPAIEPRKDYFPDADVVAKAEGKTIGGVKASLQWVRRGRRPWHVQTLFAREPGDPTSGLGGYSAGSVSGR